MNWERLHECWGHYGAVPVAQKCARSYCQKTLGCHVNLNETIEHMFQCCFSGLTLNGRSVLQPNWEIQSDTLLIRVLFFLTVFEPFGSVKGEQVPLSKSKTTLGQDLTNKQNQQWQKQTTGGKRTTCSELQNMLWRSQLWCIGRISWCVFVVCFHWLDFILSW